MPTPFPGMDPYLERATLWPDVHNRLIVLLADELAPRLRPRYYVSIEERAYTVGQGDLVLAGRADLAVVQPAATCAPLSGTGPGSTRAALIVELPLPDDVRETYLEVHAVENDRVITVLEILSPANKRPGEGRDKYLRKRLRVSGTLTHFVEIDLLRAGERMPMRGDTGQGDYRILISRGETRPRAELFPFGVRQPIPLVRLPLLPGDEEPLVDLNGVLHDLYDRAGYDLRVNYAGESDPPLRGEDAGWAEELLRAAGYR